MNSIGVHRFERPDETRRFPNGHIDLVSTSTGMVGWSVFEPGWRGSNDVKPIAQTDTCQTPHVGYVVSGTLHIEMADGESAEIGPGAIASIPPGHDAWVVGDEPAVMVDWAGATNYAKSS